jgi:hypothetical protein
MLMGHCSSSGPIDNTNGTMAWDDIAHANLDGVTVMALV